MAFPTRRCLVVDVGRGSASTLSMKLLIRVEALLHRVSQEARVHGLDAVLDVGAQRGLEAGSLPQGELPEVEGQIDRSVQHEPADPLREQLCVGGAELGAVGRPEVAERRLSEDGAQDVHVARRLDGAHVGGQRARPLRAAAQHRLGEADEPATLGCRVGVGVGGDVLVERPVTQAVHLGALARPAGIEADDVEAVEEGVPEDQAGLGGVVGAGLPGPAGVDHE